MTAPRRRLLVATGSAHKLIELQRLFGDLPIDLVTLSDRGITDEAPEDGATFEENALQKARWYAAASGEWTLADDSGLEVVALNGAPGVYTRRYAGANATDVQNYEKLLAAMAEVADRSARFVCTMALIDPVVGSERTFRGECPGALTTAPRGRSASATTRSSRWMAEQWRNVPLQRKTHSVIAVAPPRSSRQRLGVSSNKRAERRAWPLRLRDR